MTLNNQEKALSTLLRPDVQDIIVSNQMEAFVSHLWNIFRTFEGLVPQVWSPV